MSNVLMLYASTTGNTEMVMEIIAEYLEDHQYEVDIKSFDFDAIEVEDIPNYDAVLVGTHTWDDGELPYEVEDFYEELEDVDITGKLFGVFGSADSFYDTYGGAIDLLADRIKHLGGRLVPTRLKIDLEPNKKDAIRCEAFAQLFCEMIEGKEVAVKEA